MHEKTNVKRMTND